MTNDEAKTVFLNRGYVEVDGGTIYDADKWRESCHVISEWLEQEPCEDCISRNKVLEGKVIHQSCDGVEIINSYAVPVEYIKQLPPVTPRPETAYWIFVDECKEHGRCSRCGYGSVDLVDGRPHNYCPNCGTKMQAESNIKQGLNYADEDTLMPAT